MPKELTDAAIWHLVRDDRDPDWLVWDVYDGTGRFRGHCDTLAQVRHIYQVRLHRGLHPDPGKRKGVEFVPPECVHVGHWRVYWFSSRGT